MDLFSIDEDEVVYNTEMQDKKKSDLEKRIRRIHERVRRVRSSEEVGVRYLRSLEEKNEEREEGREEGRDEINQLNAKLIEDGRTDDLLRSAKDKEYQKKTVGRICNWKMKYAIESAPPGLPRRSIFVPAELPDRIDRNESGGGIIGTKAKKDHAGSAIRRTCSMKKKRTGIILLLALLLLLAPSAGVSAKTKKVAKIGQKTYTSMWSAFASVKKGQTIKLLSNVTLENYSFRQSALNKNVKYTIDLNKKTLNLTGKQATDIFFINKGNVTIKNGTLKCRTMEITKKAKVTFSNVTFKDIVLKISGEKYTFETNIHAQKSSSVTFKKCEMSSGSVLAQDKASLAFSGGTYGSVVNEGSKRMTINSGTFFAVSNDGPGSTLVKNAVVKSKENSADPAAGKYVIGVDEGTMTIQNCTFTGTRAAMIVGEKGTLIINGGSYSLSGYYYSTGGRDYGTMFFNDGRIVINGGTFKRTGRFSEQDTGIVLAPTASLTSGPNVTWINCN